jgi:hypothetical protein
MVLRKLISSLPAHPRTSKRINGLIRNSCVLLITLCISAAFCKGSGFQKTNGIILLLSKDTVKEYNSNTGQNDSVVLTNTTNDTLVIDSVSVCVDSTDYSKWEMGYLIHYNYNGRINGYGVGKDIFSSAPGKTKNGCSTNNMIRYNIISYKIWPKSSIIFVSFAIDCSVSPPPTYKKDILLKRSMENIIKPITAQITIYVKNEKDTLYLTGDYDSSTCIWTGAINHGSSNSNKTDKIDSHLEYYSINGVKISGEKLMDKKLFYRGIYICKANGHVFLQIK